MPGHSLQLTELRGTPAACGREYGRIFEPLILGFLQQELAPDRRRLAYARRCWKHIERWTPASARFMRGVARGAKLPLELVTLATLHEEVWHLPHCTAFAATRAAARGAKTLLGQNWDWPCRLYPWAGLLRLSLKGSPRRIAYHFPGLWACAGVNEAGLALVWTGGGYYPKVPPVAGVPTYVLIDEILRRKNVGEALRWLRRAKRAGAFIFFLGDAAGRTAVVEAVPRRMAVEEGSERASRANHYECEEILRCAAQVRPDRRRTSTLQRAARMAQLVGAGGGRLSVAAARRVLTDRGTAWPWLHQYPRPPGSPGSPAGMTVDSLLAVCQERVFWTCRGGRTPGPWRAYTV